MSLASFLVAAMCSGVPLKVTVVKSDGWSSVRLEARSGTKLEWSKVIQPGGVFELASVRPEATFTVEVIREDGQRSRTEPRVLSEEATVTRIDLTIEGIGPGGILVRNISDVPLPASLKVSVIDADDVTGLGTLRIDNQSNQVWEVAAFVDGPAEQWRMSCASSTWGLAPFQTSLIPLTRFIPSRALAAGQSFERRVVLARQLTRATVSFPFVAKAGEARAAFPRTHVAYVGIHGGFDDEGRRCLPLRSGGTIECACDGMSVGKEGRTLRLADNALVNPCLVTPDGGCQALRGAPSNLGDFPQ